MIQYPAGEEDKCKCRWFRKCERNDLRFCMRKWYLMLLFELRYGQTGKNDKGIFRSCQTSKIELLAKIVNGFQLLPICAKSSILNLWQGSECSFSCITLQYLKITRQSMRIRQLIVYVQISRLILSEFKRINYLLFPLKSYENRTISDYSEIIRNSETIPKSSLRWTSSLPWNFFGSSFSSYWFILIILFENNLDTRDLFLQGWF